MMNIDLSHTCQRVATALQNLRCKFKCCNHYKRHYIGVLLILLNDNACRVEREVPSPTVDSPIRKSLDFTRASTTAKVYPVPQPEEFCFEITVKVLQTSRHQRNKLSLARDILKTVKGEVTNLTFLKNNTNVLDVNEDRSGTGYFISAIGLLSVLCGHLSKAQDKMTSTSTSGIWDVSEY